MTLFSVRSKSQATYFVLAGEREKHCCITLHHLYFLCNCLCVLFLGLFPAVLNLASMADITANATCGSTGPEMFCKLVEHVPGQPVRNPQCRICNQGSSKPFGKKDTHAHTRTFSHILTHDL